MKKIIILIITVLNFITAAFCQTKISKKEKLKAQIIAFEKAGWEAWKNKDVTWFRVNTTEECLWVNSEGVSDKAQMITSIPADCNVTGFSIDNFKFVILNKNAVLLTYTAIQHGYCGNKKLTEKIRASVNYVKREGKWLEAFYMETPFVE